MDWIGILELPLTYQRLHCSSSPEQKCRCTVWADIHVYTCSPSTVLKRLGINWSVWTQRVMTAGGLPVNACTRRRLGMLGL